MLNRLSLTARLTLFYMLVLVSVLLGLGMLVGVSVNRHFVELDQDYLQDKVGLIQEVANRSASASTLQARLDEVLHSHHGLYVQLRQNNALLYASTTTFRFPEPLTKGTGKNAEVLTWREGGQEYRGLCAARAPGDETKASALTICAAVDIRHHAHFLTAFQQSLALYILLASLLGGVLGWWAARNGLAPLRAMKARAQAVTAHKLDAHMPVEAVPVEMADLAQSLNAMLLRLQDDFRRLSEFSTDLAHELRTPISNLLTETQVAISQRRTTEEYRDILASNAEEFQRLARTVSDMLFLAKTEHGLVLPSRESIAVEDEVQALFDFYDALAEEQNIRLHLIGSGTICGDRLMLRRAISNLLSNALRYTPAQGEIRVEIAFDGNDTTISVINTGPAIDQNVLPRLFDRFYRADKSRASSNTDGAGLGLAITRSIAVVHGGHVGVTSDHGKTCFYLVFPKGNAKSKPAQA